MATDHNFIVKNGLDIDGANATIVQDGNETRITSTGEIRFRPEGSSSNKVRITLNTTHISGNLQANGINHSNGVEILDMDHATYTMLKSPEGDIGLHIGDSGDTGNYYSNTTHHVRSRDGATYFTTTNSSGLNVRTGTIKIDGTTVIDSSRNLTNIGTISSSYFNSSSNIHSTGVAGFTVGGGRIGFDQSGTRSWTMGASSGYLNIFSGDGNGDLNLANSIGLRQNGTLVLTSARNLQNIGTINTGQGATEVYLMNQNVRSSDSPTFQDLTIQGNLSITGDINSYNVTDLDVVDKTITVGVGGTASANDGAGIIVDGANAKLTWNNTGSYWQMNKKLAFNDTATTSNQGLGLVWTGFDKESTTDSTDSASIVHTTNAGGHAGSVLYISAQNDANDGIAFVTHSSSYLKHNSNNIFTDGYHPNADTLTTARTIGGVSFNGSANINLPGVNTAGNQNTSGTAAGLSGTPNITVGTINSGAITSSGNIITTSTSAVIQTPRISMEADGTLDWGSSRQYGTLTWDTNKAIIAGQVNTSLEFKTNNTGVALTLDTSQNATFAGDLYLSEYVYHTGDTDTYIRIQDNSWTFRTGGGDRVIIDNSEMTTKDINVGGTGNSRVKVRHIEGKNASDANFGDLYLNYNSTGNVVIGHSGNLNDLYIYGSLRTGGTARIDNSGNLNNIGTISSGAIATSGQISISKANPVLILNDTTASSNADQVAYISFQDNGTEEAWVGWGSSGNTNFTINNNIGNIVLNGSTTVNAALTATQLNINSGTTNTCATFDSSDDKAFIIIRDDDTDAYLITKDGNFSIGNTSSDYDNFKVNLSNGNTVIDGTISSGKIEPTSLRIASGGYTGDIQEGEEYKYYLVGASTADNNWKKICDVAVGTGLYKALTMKVTLESQNGNFGNTYNVETSKFIATYYRSGGTQDDANNAVLAGINPTNHQLRIIKTATGAYELQILMINNYKDAFVKIEVLSTNGGTVTMSTGINNGSTTGTVYSASSQTSVKNIFNSIDTGTITSTGDLDLTGVSDTADEKIILPRGGHIAFYGDGSLNHAISSMGTDDIRINSYGEVILNLDSNNNQTNAANFRIVKHGGTSSAGTAVFSVDGENGNVTVTGTVDGRDVATDGTKLDTIATNADVTPSWVPSSNPSYATQTYVGTQISNLVDSSPSTLNTLNELAAALGDDANFSTTVTNSIATKLPKSGGTMTGDITISNTSPALNLVDTNSFSDANDLMVYRAADNRVRWEFYDNSAGTTTTLLDLDSTGLLKTDDLRLNADHHLQRSNHHSGHLEGSYNNVAGNALKTNPIYSIGSNYNPNEDTLNNFYGIGYSKNTASFMTGALDAGNNNGWGLYVAADGDARIFLNGSHGIINSTGEHYVNSQRVFHDGYHPNADAWTTARTITLAGDLTGNVSINGTSNVTLTAAVADDSHNHVISNIDGLQTTLNNKIESSYTGFDSRYYTESEMQTYFRRGYIESQTASSLAAGWYTVATNTGDRAIGDFTLWDVASGDHQGVHFKASHFFGQDHSNDLTVLHYARYSGSPIRYIRIKDGSTYDGAALQVYIDESSNSVGIAITGGNPPISGWVLKDWIPDATDPGDLSSYSSMGERVRVDLDLIPNGGQQTSGAVIIGNPSNVLSNTNLSIYQDSSTADQIKFYDGTTRMGEIGTQDTTWLRINNHTNKNIYTPRYIRADNGFFVDGSSKGINGSGNFVGGTITGASDANVSNWDTAYGWGNHASAGYATGSFLPLSGGTLTGAISGTTATFFADGAAGTNALNILGLNNGNGTGITFSDNGTPAASSSGQNGYMYYYHGDGQSYGSGNAFVLSSSESTTTILADGKLMFKEGIYSKPSSGTGAGTRKDANWDTAYGWGNHASAGYITASNSAITNKLPLAGGTMSGALNMANQQIYGVNNLRFNDPGVNEGIKWDGGSEWQIYESPNAQTNAAGNLQFTSGSGNGTRRMTITTSGTVEASAAVRSNGGEYYGNASTSVRYRGYGDEPILQGVSGATYLYAGGSTTTALTLQAGRTIAPILSIGQVNSYTDIVDSGRNLVNITSATFSNDVAINNGSPELYFGTTGNHYNWRIAAQENVNAALEISVGSQDTNYANDTYTTKFHITNAGNATFAGNVTAYSDERLKDNIETLDGSKVYEMRGVSFEKEGVQGSGVIAQELEKIAPELVQTTEDEMGTKSVAYGNLVGYLIEAIKEQQKEIDYMKSEIKKLKGE